MSIHIGYILNRFPVITETFILNEIVALQKLNQYKISVISLNKPEEINSKLEIDIEYLPPFFSYKVFVAIIRNIIKRPAKGLLLFGKSMQICRLNLFKGFKRFAIVSYLCENVINRMEINHFHAHFANFPTDIALLAAFYRKKTFSFTAHAKDIFCTPKYEIRDKLIAAKFIVTCTKYNRKYLSEIAGSKVDSKIHHVYHGIDMAKWIPDDQQEWFKEEEQKLNKEEIELLTIARLVEKKGIIYLIKAIAMLKNNGYSINAVIIGEGPLKEDLIKLSKELCVMNMIKFKPFISQSEIKKHLSVADIFILPSVFANNQDQDGLPNVLLEAMAMNVPIITTNISAIPELVVDGYNGITVNERDFVAIANAITELYGNKENNNKITNNGAITIGDFDLYRQIAILDGIFKKYLAA
jgi:colanic acid/amylovoran biosynthesis glycosyltransferase